MESGAEGVDEAQRRVIGHRRGPLLVTGTAGAGRTEALVRRFASLSEDGVRAERILVACRTRAGAETLEIGSRRVLEHAHEEPWIGTHAEIAERILREHPTEAGLDPSSPPSRLPTVWRSCSTESTTFRFAAMRSAATLPGFWPVSFAGSTS